jgi:hypothetical protein
MADNWMQWRVEPESAPPDTAPEEVSEPGRKRNTPDAEWLSLATADPAYFLNDLPSG